MQMCPGFFLNELPPGVSWKWVRDIRAPPFGRRRLGAADWAPPFGRRDRQPSRDKWAPPFGRWTFRRYC